MKHIQVSCAAITMAIHDLASSLIVGARMMMLCIMPGIPPMAATPTPSMPTLGPHVLGPGLRTTMYVLPILRYIAVAIACRPHTNSVQFVTGRVRATTSERNVPWSYHCRAPWLVLVNECHGQPQL